MDHIKDVQGSQPSVSDAEQAYRVPILLHPHTVELAEGPMPGETALFEVKVHAPSLMSLRTACGSPVLFQEAEEDSVPNNVENGRYLSTRKAIPMNLSKKALENAASEFHTWTSESEAEETEIVIMQYIPSLVGGEGDEAQAALTHAPKVTSQRPPDALQDRLNLLSSWHKETPYCSMRLEELKGLKLSLESLAHTNHRMMLLRSLQYLACWRGMTPQLLIESKIASALQPLRKHNLKPVQQMAAYIIRCWKQVMLNAAKELIETSL